MGVCQKCRFFRRVKPSSQLFANVIGTADAIISNALAKIQEDEDQQRGYEAQQRMRKEIANDELWGFRPLMSGYCGLRESEDMYLISEIKNLGGRCTDFKEGAPEKQSCDRCIHNTIPEGRSKDLSRDMAFLQMSLESAAVGMTTSRPDTLLNKNQESSTSRKAFEIKSAYSSKGILSFKPQYLAYCKKFSNEDDYVICLLKNSHNTCSAWEANSSTA